MVSGPPPYVFVSYRRQDTSHLAGRLYDRLVDRFGQHHVFMDVDSIDPGSDFHEAIHRAVGSSDVVLALIGTGWATASDEHGRRLDNPGDLVRVEIQAALDQNVRLIPVLVDGARMPEEDEVPVPLRALRRRHATHLDHATFRSDVETLIATIARLAQQRPRAPVPPEPINRAAPRPTGEQHPRTAAMPVTRPSTPDSPAPRRTRALVVALAVLALVGAVLLGRWYLTARVPVPNLTGMSISEAQHTLGSAGLVLASGPAIMMIDDPRLVDRIVDQLPAAGERVEARTTVSVSVGATRPAATDTAASVEGRLEMPDVIGERLDDAQATLAGAGLVNIRVEIVGVTDPGTAGRVVSQAPAAGTVLDANESVTIVVAQDA
jgi:hypothetical protein